MLVWLRLKNLSYKTGETVSGMAAIVTRLGWCVTPQALLLRYKLVSVRAPYKENMPVA